MPQKGVRFMDKYAQQGAGDPESGPPGSVPGVRGLWPGVTWKTHGLLR